MFSFAPSHFDAELNYSPYPPMLSLVASDLFPTRQSFAFEQEQEERRIHAARVAAARERRQQAIQRAAIEQAIQRRLAQEREEEAAKEELRAFERAWIFRHQEMIRRAHQAEADRAKHREEMRLRQIEEQQRREYARRTRQGQETEAGFESVLESLLPHLLGSRFPRPAPENMDKTSSTGPSESEQPSANVDDQSTEVSLSSEDEAASISERQARRQIALDKLSTLTSSFEERQSAFAEPAHLEFQASPTPPFTTPRLAFVSVNGPVLSHEDFLVNLLSEIDSVESRGDRDVKRERKALVKAVEAELAKLDEIKERAWTREETIRRTSERESTATSSETSTTTAEARDGSLLTPHLDEDDEEVSLPAPLTREAVSTLDPRSTDRAPSPALSDSGSSTTSSTLTVSSSSSQLDLYISEMLRRAQKLGQDDSIRAAPLPSSTLVAAAA